jgi:hypothetical protein
LMYGASYSNTSSASLVAIYQINTSCLQNSASCCRRSSLPFMWFNLS